MGGRTGGSAGGGPTDRAGCARTMRGAVRTRSLPTFARRFELAKKTRLRRRHSVFANHADVSKALFGKEAAVLAEPKPAPSLVCRFLMAVIPRDPKRQLRVHVTDFEAAMFMSGVCVALPSL